jgi:hypothetical protein
MTGTYKAVLYGPNPIAAGTEVELEYTDGEYQDIVITEAAAEGETIARSYRKGQGTEEPIPYRFVDEQTTVDEADVPN